MTPTLMGRWQTRIALLATVGLIVSIPFALVLGSPAPFVVVGWVALFGLAWDVLYTFVQAFRWERDWPPAFAVVAAIIEGAVVYVLVTRIGLWGVLRDLSAGLFSFQYAVVWIATFLFAQGPMRVLFPWWRFHGGRVWPGVATSQRR